MALRCIKLLRTVRSASLLRHNIFSTALSNAETEKPKKEFRTENNLNFFEDPDTFGTLSYRLNKDKVVLEDESDIQEEKHSKNTPLPSQQLTTKQYADIIKQYLGHKRLKEALDVLEVRMLKKDRVKPENYIYNILIGACADVGYTKKAFSLYNDMKKRALKATGDTYTCLFHACSNSPFPSDGLKRASHLRELMKEKGIEPNMTNYNAMIKAFGRCGELATAFRIVDEMVLKDIKIRVHTFNHMLQACISDKEDGLRHALIVWRKMLKMKEKPNIYSFNLMLKCVKDCNMGSKEDIEELISLIQEQIAFENQKKALLLQQSKSLLTQSQTKRKSRTFRDDFEILADLKPNYLESIKKGKDRDEFHNLPDIRPIQNENDKITNEFDSTKESALAVSIKPDSQEPDPPNSGSKNNLPAGNNNVSLQLVKLTKLNEKEVRRVPNLLSKELQLEQVLSLQEVKTLQEKFAVIGGQDDFLKEMQAYSVKPDIKIFTQMLPLLEETEEAEVKLLDTMKSLDLKADIDFYNMLIKKRCLRLDYDAAFAVREIIEKESKWRKRKYPLKKKLRLKPNIMTYGVLAMACKTKESAQKLLNDMKEERIKVNIEILGTLLKQGAIHCDFGYVLHIMKEVKEENIQVNHMMLKHLEEFKERTSKNIKSKKKGDVFLESYRIFTKAYTDWLKEVNPEEALNPEHPWSQFKNTYPETVQRQSFEIEEPNKFYKRNRKGVKYVPTV